MSRRSVRIPRRLAAALGSVCLTVVAGCDLIQGSSGTIVGSNGGSPADSQAAPSPTATDPGATSAPTATAIPTPPIPVQTTAPCNYPTTVPGGTVPQPLCADASESTTPAPIDESPAPQGSSFTCPVEDYPIVQISESWAPYSDAPATFTWCSGGGSVESTDAKIIVPTQPLAGVDAAERAGVELSRMPGGTHWFGTVAIPSQGARQVQLKTSYSMFPRDFDEVGELCQGQPETTVRGSAGCVNGNDLVWRADDVVYILTISPDLNAAWDDVVAWTNTWASR